MPEGDPAVRGVLEHAIGHERMVTKAPGDGEAALEHLREAESYGLVILDVMLLGIEWVELCRELRAGGAGPGLADVPVVMLPARDDETSVIVGPALEADDYVTRPFRPRELVNRVRAHLRRQRRNARAGGVEPQKLEHPGVEVNPLRR